MIIDSSRTTVTIAATPIGVVDWSLKKEAAPSIDEAAWFLAIHSSFRLYVAGQPCARCLIH